MEGEWADVKCKIIYSCKSIHYIIELKSNRFDDFQTKGEVCDFMIIVK
jgi:hypothetical protein